VVDGEGGRVTFGSRQKGSRAELEIAAMFKRWWDPVNPSAVFKRVPLSGGWGDADARGKFKAAGDVMTDCLRFGLCLEIKRREGWTLDTLRRGKRSPVWAWWRQCVRSAREVDRVPMLIFRKNRSPWYVMLPADQALPDAGEIVSQWEHSDQLVAEGVDFAGVLPTMTTLLPFFELNPWLYALPVPATGG
jgi:hypothetical protein